MRIVETSIVLTRIETMVLEGDTAPNRRPSLIRRMREAVLEIVGQYRGEKIVIRTTR